MDVEQLLEQILGDDGHYCLLAYHLETERIIQNHYNTIPLLVENANRLDKKGYDTYFAVSTFKTDESREAENSKQVRSFFLDIDCGDGKKKDYPTQEEAIKALRQFCKKLKLPKPFMVNSGRGVHVYWPLEEPVPSEEWLPIAEHFKGMLRAHGLSVDHSVPADRAQVLRVMGTHNHKPDCGKVVTPFGSSDITPVNLDDFIAAIGADNLPPPVKHIEGAGAVMQALLGNKKNNFKDILTKTSEGKGCEQLEYLIVNQEEVSEPLWRAGLSIAKFCEDGEKAAHLISNKHPDYNEDETTKKFEQIKGPYLCESFNEFNAGICENCPNFGDIKSPVSLGSSYERADGDETLFADDTEYTIPEYPAPYFRGVGGGIYMETVDKKGEPLEKHVYHNDLYVMKRVHDPEFGESIVMRLHLPKDGVREFTVPLKTVTSQEEFRKILSEQGVAVPRVGDLVGYAMSWINKLQSEVVAENAHKQFGWTNDKMDEFVLGDKVIYGDRIEANAPAAQTVQYFPYFKPKGTLEQWKNNVNFWNREGLELYQFVLGTGFGSILMPLANVSGVTMHLHSGGSGVAKSAAMFSALGLWGNPDSLVLQFKDSDASSMNRAEVYRNIPFGVDEITNIEPKAASDQVYGVSTGHQKNRMSANSNQERYRGESWNLISLTTANRSIVEIISMDKEAPKAEAQRILECFVPDVSHMFSSKKETDIFENDIKECYGHAGPVFVQWVINNVDEVRRICLEVQEKVDTIGELKQPNRFWSAGVTYTIAGLIIARRIGLINYSIKAIFEWVMDVLLPQNKISSSSLEASIYDVMARFLHDNYGFTISTASTYDGRKNNDEGIERLVIPDEVARGKLYVRYEKDTNKFFIVPKILKLWCGKKHINFRDLERQLKEHCKCKRGKMRLSKGTALKLPPADVFVMEFPEGTMDEVVDGNKDNEDTDDL